jgi:hypothetical protein
MELAGFSESRQAGGRELKTGNEAERVEKCFGN